MNERILFVCRYNRFRSKIAEAHYKKKGGEVKGAGFFPGIPLSEDILQCGKELKLELENKTQGLNHDLIMWADKIIIIDHFDSLGLFDDYIKNDGKKVVHWEIKDIEGDSVTKRVDTAKKIIERIDKELK